MDRVEENCDIMGDTEMTELIQLTSGWDVKGRAVPNSTWSRELDGWAIDPDELTPRSATVALILFPELAKPHPILTEWRDKLIQDVRPFDNATPFAQPIAAPYVREVLRAEDKDLFEFQELDLGYIVAILKEHGGAYIGWERGLGKTIGALAIVEELDAQQVLIVAPNTAKGPVWQAEASRYSRLPVFVLPNPKPKREAMMTRVHEMVKAKEAFILVTHYEAIAIIGGKDGRGWKKYGTWDIVVSDETHRIKNPKAKMTRAIKKIPTRAKLALSGSLVENHLEELFSPLQWLFPERYRSKWRDWNDRFLDYVEGGYKPICVGVKRDQLEALRSEIGVFMTYRRKQDELDLPDRIDQTLFVDLSAGQRKAYDELVTTCITQLDDDSFIAARDGLPMLIKLRQIATGLDLVGEDIEDSTKLDLAMEMILDNEDEAFVVFTWFKAAGRALQTRLENSGVETFRIDGDVKQTARDDYIERFQSGEGRVLIGTISTMGESVNLFRANNAVFLDRSWNPGQNVQAEDRIYRIGQENNVTITHIVAADTCDEYRVQPTLANKSALRKLILGG